MHGALESLTLADTIGVANPLQVKSVLRTVRKEFPNLPQRIRAVLSVLEDDVLADRSAVSG